MGTDKAFLPVVPGGPPMLALVLDRVRTIAIDVMVVANDEDRYRSFGVRVVPDIHSEIGALGGIHAAISHSVHEHCLVVACDMPFLNTALLARMAREPRDYDVLIPMIPGESRQGGDGLVLQTLHAIYSKRCLPYIEARIAEGNRQVIGFFEDVRVRPMKLPDIEEWDPELRSFFNANTPQALHAATEISNIEEPPAAGSRFPNS